MKPELFLQCEFARWLDRKGILYCASPAGVKLPMITAVNLKRAGYKKGYPDIGIFHACSGYHGLFIEIKAGKNTRITPEQSEWQKALTANGYKAIIMPGNLGFQEAFDFLRKTVEDYLIT